jgi:hypothetical protein
VGNSSKVRELYGTKWRGTLRGPVALGALPIPDPRFWPIKVRRWFSQVCGDDGNLGVVILDHGDFGVMIMRDAITALGIFEVQKSEWHTEDGYPAFEFAAEKISYYARLLTQTGYNVRVVQVASRPAGGSFRIRTRGEVVSIAIARPPESTEGAKWE